MTEPSPDGATSDQLAYADPADLAVVRAFVAARATACGLPPGRVELLILAISELATNTLQHTGGGGRVCVWLDRGQIVCDVVDGGSLRWSEAGMPAADAVRGRGLAIVRRLCDVVEVAAVAEGTRVQVRLNL